MQAAIALLIIGSTAWLAVDASKRDWTDNSFAKNVPTWVIGSLLLWLVIFPMYLFVQRKKAPLKTPPKAPSAPAVAMCAAGPSEQYGPSLDDVEPEAPKTEHVVEVHPEPVVEVEQESAPSSFVADLEPEADPVVELEAEPQPVSTVDPVVEPEPEAVEMAEPVEMATPVVELEPEPDPVVELEAEPVAEPEPEPVVETEPEPVAQSEPDPDPVLEISYPDVPADEAPPGLSVDAFKDIKPVAFGGIVVEEDEPAPMPEPEPVVETAPAPEPEPMLEPEPMPEPEPEPVPAFEPLSYPLDQEPVLADEPVFVDEPVFADEPDAPSIAAAVSEPEPEQPKKRGLRLPNPGLKLPQITLPPNLQGPLNDIERKIVLGSVVVIVAAAAFGYSTAPSDETVAPTPAPAPAAASR